MKKISQLKHLLFLSLIIIFISNTQATTIFTNAPLSALTGDNFDVEIFVSDVTDFSSFQFNLQFDPSILTANLITSGDVFGLNTFSLNNEINIGTANLSELTFAATGLDIAAPTLLATINFSADNIGNSLLSLNNVIFSDSLGASITPITILDTNITISASQNSVPSPASIWILLLGMIIFSSKQDALKICK